VQSLMPMLTHLVKDDQESVRKLALESSPAFASALANTDSLPEVLDACAAVFTDRSWRVRHAAAARMPALAKALGADLAEQHLVKAFVSLLQVCALVPGCCARTPGTARSFVPRLDSMGRAQDGYAGGGRSCAHAVERMNMPVIVVTGPVMYLV
jgi:hypothetical protein